MADLKLPKDLEAWVRDEIASGRAESRESLVERALREHRMLTDGHRALVEQAYASAARGAVREGADVDAELNAWIMEDITPR